MAVRSGDKMFHCLYLLRPSLCLQQRQTHRHYVYVMSTSSYSFPVWTTWPNLIRRNFSLSWSRLAVRSKAHYLTSDETIHTFLGVYSLIVTIKTFPRIFIHTELDFRATHSLTHSVNTNLCQVNST